MKRVASDLCRRLIFNFNDPGWNEDDVAKLKTWEIEILCKLLGAPKSGPREKVIVRLLETRNVRGAISAYPCDRDGAVALATAKRKEWLKWFCKQMCLWRSGTKIQLAGTLLQWRDRARLEGQKFLTSLMTAEPGTALQMEFKL
jgi:hypothetical protein